MSYAGDISSAQAFERLATEPATVLVDVRTHAEWTYVGLPDLRPIGKQIATVSWSHYPGAVPNEAFVDELAAAGVTTGGDVLFLCRSGVRSRSAAMAATAAGYTAYNISDGFEGPVDADGHRNTVGGWRSTGLPWRQT